MTIHTAQTVRNQHDVKLESVYLNKLQIYVAIKS